MVHEESSPVSGAVLARSLVMSEVRFCWEDEKPGGELSTTPALEALYRPESMTLPEMLMRIEQDASYSGNAFLVRRRRSSGVEVLDPSRTQVLLGSNSDPTWSDGKPSLPYDARTVGLVYNSSTTPGPPSAEDLEVFRLGEFVHYKPEPDPACRWRGSSWVTSLLSDVALDGQIDDHQSKFFEHAATPNLVFLMNPDLDEHEVGAYAKIVNDAHAGTSNAYKNMFLGGAVDVKTVGVDLSKLSLRDLQGGTETRVSMRSRVPAPILGIREGLAGSSLNTGNYGASRRLFADGWFQPTIGGLCAALEALFPPPPGKRMSYDPSRVLFLQEDRKDEAEISGLKTTAIRTLVDGGFDPASAVATIAPEWVRSLRHDGLLSVQLQEPGAPSADNRTVMGRLGRIDDPEMVDPDALVAGVDERAASAVLHALDVTGATDMETLRAEVLAALTGEPT
jgi:hypothetical protein